MKQIDFFSFEHVFVGEIKSSEVSGFHNWVQFYLRESVGDVNYYGYISKLAVHKSFCAFKNNFDIVEIHFL